MIDKRTIQPDERAEQSREENKVLATLGYVSHGALETVERFGRANEEYLKGYRGVDQQTGRRFSKGLKDIAKHKVNPQYADQNIKQQAGFSAEVLVTADENAEAVINGGAPGAWRADDLPEIYGKNHTVVDRVRIDGSEVQTKFVKNPKGLLCDVAREPGHRYQEVIIEVPSEQFHGNPELVKQYEAKAAKARSEAERLRQLGTDEGNRDAKLQENLAKKLQKQADSHKPLAERCRLEAEELRRQADAIEKNGNLDLAQEKREQAQRLEERSNGKIADAGITTEEAIEARKHAKWTTFKRLSYTSHRAGMEGAKFGSLIGGSISVLTNGWQVFKGNKEWDAALRDTALTTGKAAVAGYATGYVGSFGQGLMAQSSKEWIRGLSKANPIPAAINLAVQCSGSVKRLVRGEIDEAQFLEEIGQVGSTALMSSMMAVVGQVAIPIPVVGGLIGGFIGSTLSGLFYQHALDAVREKNMAKKRLEYVQALADQAKVEMARQRYALQQFIDTVFVPIRQEGDALLQMMANTESLCPDEFARKVNQYADLFGKRLQFVSQDEFDDFMKTEELLRI